MPVYEPLFLSQDVDCLEVRHVRGNCTVIINVMWHTKFCCKMFPTNLTKLNMP